MKKGEAPPNWTEAVAHSDTPLVGGRVVAARAAVLAAKVIEPNTDSCDSHVPPNKAAVVAEVLGALAVWGVASHKDVGILKAIVREESAAAVLRGEVPLQVAASAKVADTADEGTPLWASWVGVEEAALARSVASGLMSCTPLMNACGGTAGAASLGIAGQLVVKNLGLKGPGVGLAIDIADRLAYLGGDREAVLEALQNVFCSKR